ncbi:MAG TPA: hypothetical protein VFG54_06750 [Prolixibacteraceae bacterium]|nr:hypothetical protein [Prolixibacteraceae bacterium]
MIYTDNDTLEITQKIIISQKDFRALMSRYLIHNITHTPLNFHTSNFEKEAFVVDWQLSMEENSRVDNLWY